jgi:hypothetical protein
MRLTAIMWLLLALCVSNAFASGFALADAQTNYDLVLGSYRSHIYAEERLVQARGRIDRVLRLETAVIDGVTWYRLIASVNGDVVVTQKQKVQLAEMGYPGAWRVPSLAVHAETPVAGAATAKIAVSAPSNADAHVRDQQVDEPPGAVAAAPVQARTTIRKRTPAGSTAEFDVRFKAFGTGAYLPDHDAQRLLTGTPAYDTNLDLRLMFRDRLGPVTLLADAAVTWVAGDSQAFLFRSPQATLDQSPLGDARRVMDLTWEIDDGERYTTVARFDRLAARYRTGRWSVTLGREAVSWGGGMVFQPMDLFNPFAPTTVDRDYKAGDDLLLVERLLDNGSDLQMLVVGRRRAIEEEITGQAFSAALKWHGFWGAGEFELLAAKHYVDQVYGAGVRYPLGGALLRADLVYTRLRNGGGEFTGMVNIDYSLVVGERNVYVFGEYFHNGFGVRELPFTPSLLPEPLVERLARGELFNAMRDYTALGGRIEWHPLVNHSLTLISNLHDSSSLMQMQLTYEPSDASRLELGWVEPLGRPGDEFGGVPLLGPGLTTGSGSQIYARWVYYW